MHLLALILFSICCVSCQLVSPSSYENHVASQKTHKTNSGPMSYVDKGKGETVILLHGVPTSSWVYRKVIPGLAKNYRVIAPDLVGYGSSAKPKNDGSVYKPEEQAKRVRELMKNLGIKRYSIVMHDMGGLVAWEMMRQDSASIQNIVLLNTIIHKQGFHPPQFSPGNFSKNLMKAYSNEWSSDAVLGMTFKSLGLKNSHKLTREECYGYVKPIKDGSDEALYAFFTNLDENLSRRLEQNKTAFQNFQGKTLILWGAKDKILTTQQLPFAAKHLKIPSSNIHIYPENDHFLAEEIPSELVERISQFLQ